MKSFAISLYIALFVFTVPAYSNTKCFQSKKSLIDRVCVGDLVRGQKQNSLSGIVLEIDQSTNAADSSQPVFLKVQEADQNGVAIPAGKILTLNSHDLAIMTPNACYTKSGQKAICINDRYKDANNGANYTILAFSIAEGFGTSPNIIVRAKSSNYETRTNPPAIYEARRLAETGMMVMQASCYAEIIKFEWRLKRCARKKALSNIESKCNRYCGGRGSLDSHQLQSNQVDLGCTKKWNLFPPHGKSCSIRIEAACSCR